MCAVPLQLSLGARIMPQLLTIRVFLLIFAVVYDQIMFRLTGLRGFNHIRQYALN